LCVKSLIFLPFHSVVTTPFPTWKKSIPMTEKEFYQLLDRYLQATCTEEEKTSVENFIQNNLDKPSEIAAWEQERKNEAARRLKGRVMSDIRTSARSVHVEKFKWVSIAASILLIAVLGYLFIGNQNEAFEIPLITKNTTPGQKLTVQLSDGTTVFLNAGSSLSFPEQFKENREVHLSGEAFFEVTKKPSKPFIVKSGVLRTEVLGTSFNVKAYPEEKEIQVTVASGKVQVKRAGSTDKAPILAKGQQAHYDINEGKLAFKEVDPARFLLWKDGIIQFGDESLVQAFNRLERWYGVEFEMDERALQNCFISSTYQDETLENILMSMNFINGISYEFINDTKIKITGTACNE